MSNESSFQLSKNRYGPLGFLAALVNILLLNSLLWTLFLYSFWGYEYVLPVLLADLVVSAALNFFAGPLGHIGRGMLIGWISVPVSLLILGIAIPVAHAIGPI